ncbi:hypothetical protein Q5H93_21140 [Hymenobacter sp. ASUV-10]|uniref:Uncharacterized protein n=1 Tax=Hymenobacter aranciens TaxID=3063996 RepID=A0ABT9BG81_9BACT|nr:hypothetical protein [Hymenobacter sp. ASUV-10]MDO7877264.1 hypothetical protein [Hymenobacter sp. ASUV-10]
MSTPTATEITQDILTNPRYDEFFADYHPRIREMFAQTYGHEKWMWQWEGARELTNQEKAARRFGELAYDRLWDIQRKKLFDLQCRWRAGLLTLPGVDCSYDFEAHDATIENCPLPGPITPEELDMYCDFVRLAPDFDDDVMDRNGGPWYDPRGWQDYDTMKLYEQEFDRETPDHERQGIHPPAWYDFHNMRTGNGMLLSLPDVRRPAELRYRQAEADARQTRNEAVQAAAPLPPLPPDPRPQYLPQWEMEELLDDFIDSYEPAQLRREKAAYALVKDREAEDKQVVEDFEYLKSLEAADTVPLKEAANWRAALRQAVVESQRQQLLAHLPLVYDEYLLREQLGIAHPEATEGRYRDTNNPLRWRNEILDGRELLGEPRNFDF